MYYLRHSTCSIQGSLGMQFSLSVVVTELFPGGLIMNRSFAHWRTYQTTSTVARRTQSTFLLTFFG